MTDPDESLDVQQTQNKTANEIVSYLLKHPKNKDTMKGIAEWWLEMHYIDQGVDQVSMALSQLCSKQLILEKNLAGNIYYELNTTQGEKK